MASLPAGGGDSWTGSLELLPFCLREGSGPKDETGTTSLSESGMKGGSFMTY